MKPTLVSPRHLDRHRELSKVIRILALPAEETLAALPEGPDRPDRLALRFDEEYTAFMAKLVDLPSEAQLVSLQELDRALNAMSSPNDQALWTEEAVVHAPEWEQIRFLARQVVAAFGWEAQ